MTKLLFGILLIAPAPNAFAITANLTATNQTNKLGQPANDTNGLLKQIIANQKLQIQLQQNNMEVAAQKLDKLAIELQQIKTTLSTPLLLPPPGAGPCGTDPSLCFFTTATVRLRF